ncbi:aldo/keto reductase [Terrarubrum flagellatum]|uniref:aldo/keto reductase n=1 Tax=Terrirubrum flagellatum TaxID=2895980 RepID=UPI003144E5A8
MHMIEIAGGGKMPALGLGTWQLRGRDCARVVKLALSLGYRHIDTAEMYGNENEVGDAIAESGVSRGDLFVTTKIWNSNFRASAARRSAEASLRALKLDHVDLLLMHWPNDSVPLAETLGEMSRLLEEGKTRAIGVSNFPPDLLGRAIAASPKPVACDQVRFHVGAAQDDLLAVARPKGVAITAYSPLGKGGLASDRTLAKIGAKYGKSASQIALRWLIEQEGVSAIPKASSETNLRANLAIFDFKLDDEDRAMIARL